MPLTDILFLIFLISTFLCAILGLYFAIKKNPKWKYFFSGMFASFLLMFFTVAFTPHDKHQQQETISDNIATPSINNSKTDQAILGAPVENFKKVYGQLNDKYSNKEMHRYKFIDPVIDIQGNFGDLEKVQVIHIDLRKYDENTHKLISPEVFPVQSMREIDEIIAKYIPSDSTLIKEKTFKDTSLTLPTSRHKTLRLYKSKWLSENLIPFEKLPDYDRSDFLPDGNFTIIIEKLERGYLEIYLVFGTDEWSFIDSSWQEI